jgi:non-homologous end joining protein Ku
MLSAKFDPKKFHDEYEASLQRLIAPMALGALSCGGPRRKAAGHDDIELCITPIDVGAI